MNEWERSQALGESDVPYIQTEIIHVDSSLDASTMDQLLAPAATTLREGGLVAMPTETVYGLAANALNADAVKRIYLAKGRPQDNPMIVHVDRIESIKPLVASWPLLAQKLAERFMPGPLTLILPKSDLISSVVSGGLDTVGIRMPSHPVALSLIRLAAVPLAAPSANRSGRPSPTEASHVITDMDGRIDCIVDGGLSDVGLESTVLDLSAERGPQILRPGAITFEMLAEFFCSIQETVWPFVDDDWQRYLRGDRTREKNRDLDNDERILARSPGMKYRHYAPKAVVYVLKGDVVKAWQKLVEEQAGQRIGLYASDEFISTVDTAEVYYVQSFGPKSHVDQAAHDLFSAFRNCDSQQCDLIVVEALDETAVGRAYMNRLHKAATVIIDVIDD